MLRAAGPRVLRVRELDRRQHAADEHFGAVLRASASCVLVCEQIGAQRGLVLGERMAREVEAEHFLLHRRAVLSRRTPGRLGSATCVAVAAIVVVVAEQPLLAALAIGEHRRAALHRPVDRRHQLRPLRAERIERAGLDQRFDRRPAAGLRIDPLAEIEQARERPVLLARGDDRLGRAAAAALDRAQAEQNLAVGDGEIDVRAIHVRRHDLDVHPLGSLPVLDERVLALEVAARNVARQQRRHELDRIVRLEVGRL